MPEVAEEDIRAFLLPLMIPKGGSEPELAVPGILKEPYDAMKRLLGNPYQPGAGEENRQAIIDALTVGGSAGLGSIAAPRPTNSLGVFGGNLARKNLLDAGVDPDIADGILTRFMSESGEITPYIDYTGTPLLEFDLSTAAINPRLSRVYDDPSYTHGHPFGTMLLGDVIDLPNFYKAFPEAKGINVELSKSGSPELTEGVIGPLVSSPDKVGLGIMAYDKPDFIKTLAHEMNHLAQKFEGQEYGANAHTPHKEFIDQVMAERNRGGSVFELNTPPAYEAYMRNSSEVLSRLAEERANMSPIEKYHTHPAEMEHADIPRDLQFNNMVLEALRSQGYIPNIEKYRSFMVGI